MGWGANKRGQPRSGVNNDERPRMRPNKVKRVQTSATKCRGHQAHIGGCLWQAQTSWVALAPAEAAMHQLQQQCSSYSNTETMAPQKVSIKYII